MNEYAKYFRFLIFDFRLPQDMGLLVYGLESCAFILFFYTIGVFVPLCLSGLIAK